MFIITKAISESYLDFVGNHSEYFVFYVLFINNRHFLPFRRADLTTSAMNKMSSRAKRGDLTKSCKMFEMATSLRSSQRGLLCCGGFEVDGPQLHPPRLAADDLYFNNIVVASGARQSGNLDS